MMERQQFEIEIFPNESFPDDGGEPEHHLVIQTTLPGKTPYWVAFNAANAAEYVKTLLAAIVETGSPAFYGPTLDGINEFIDERIAACEAGETRT